MNINRRVLTFAENALMVILLSDMKGQFTADK